MDKELLGKLLLAAKVLAHEEEENKRLAESTDATTLIKEKHARLKKAVEEADRKSSIVGSIVGSIIFLAFGGMYLLISLIMTASGATGTGVIAIIYVPALIVGISWLAYAKTKLKPRLEYDLQIARNNLKKFEQTELKAANEEIETQKRAMLAHQADLATIKEEVLAFLPPMYRDLHAVSFMGLLIESGRAETLKEAMNMYEDERRYFTMLGAMQSMDRKLSCIGDALVIANRYSHLIAEQQSKSLSLQKADFLFG